MSKPALQRHYGGTVSKPFWKRVNACRDSTLFLAACAFQDHETRMLRMLELSEHEQMKCRRTPRRRTEGT